MSDGIKLAAICCLTVCLCVAIILIPENTNLLWGIFAALCSAIGIPVVSPKLQAIGKKIKK